jgi:hypothetical protein
MNTVEKNAAIEVDRLAQNMTEVNRISYKDALKKVSAQHPKLWARYNGFVEPGTKPYGQLTGQQKAMLELVTDSTKTKRLAALTVDVYAKCWVGIDDSGPIPQECLASYKAAVQKVLRASPSLGGCVQQRPYRFGGLGVVGIVGFVGHLGDRLRARRFAPGTESNCRHEDFQSSCRSGTMCHYRSLLVSIQAFNGGLSRSILPIRTHSSI